jgi:hypothetical protein
LKWIFALTEIHSLNSFTQCDLVGKKSRSCRLCRKTSSLPLLTGCCLTSCDARPRAQSPTTRYLPSTYHSRTTFSEIAGNTFADRKEQSLMLHKRSKILQWFRVYIP